MGKVMEGLTRYIAKTKYSDLPDEVTLEMKRVVLDSIGCAIAGMGTEKGKIAINYSRRLDGPRESTIIGTNNQVACINAAFANGELINALDFDAMSAGAAHDVPSLVAAILALAEKDNASGKDIILALALSFETTARLQSTSVPMLITTEGPEKGALTWPKVTGFSSAALAAAAGGSRLLNYNNEKIANAIGIAGCLFPPNISARFTQTSPIKMTKYGSSGSIAQAGVTSVLLTDMGYTGDTDLFDDESGFLTYNGQAHRKTLEEAFNDLGKKWYSQRVNYKQYPAGY